MDLLIRDVEIWNADGVRARQDLKVRSGRIEAILAHDPSAPVPGGVRVVEGKGHVLLPLGVDLQVHLRVPGQPQKETPETGLKAALKGAYGAVLSMPNTKPVIDTPEVLAMAREQVAPFEKKWGVRACFSVALTMGQKGEQLVDAAALKRAGALALTDDGVGVEQDEVMDRLFALAAQVGLPVLQHAEVPGHGGVLAPGAVQRKLGLPAYPAEAEWKMVERDLRLLKKHPKARYHVLHISAAESVALLVEARKQGLHATGEATPHHLYFTSDELHEDSTSFKMNPPIRGEEDRALLRSALADGRVDFVSTDHAPHEAEVKGADFRKSAYGTTGLETSLRMLLSMWRQGELEAPRLVQVFSTAPARFIGIDDEFGSIATGRPLRAALVDVLAPETPVRDSDLGSLSHNNCFLGVPLPGRILKVFNAAGAFELKEDGAILPLFSVS
jgi:dihydroorotase